MVISSRWDLDEINLGEGIEIALTVLHADRPADWPACSNGRELRAAGSRFERQKRNDRAVIDRAKSKRPGRVTRSDDT